MSDLVLKALQAGVILAVISAGDGAGVVVYTEDQPAAGEVQQVGLVGQSREVFAEVGGGEVIVGFLELYALAFPLGDERVKLSLELVRRHRKGAA